MNFNKKGERDEKSTFLCNGGNFYMWSDIVCSLFGFRENILYVCVFTVFSRDHCFRPFVCCQRNSTGKKISPFKLDQFVTSPFQPQGKETCASGL